MTPGWAAALSAGTDPELVARTVRLAATPWVTPRHVRDALAASLERVTVTAADVLAAVEGAAGPGRPLADRATSERAARALLAQSARVHVAGEPGYPPRLAGAWPELGAPLWLFVRAPDGRLPDGPPVAIVGTRRPTLDGLRTARSLAALCARHGVVVVSGMARGIDQAAHLGALDAGGRTVAVLGTGLGYDYPAGDGRLRAAVAAAGGLATELLPGAGPRKEHFLWRNRIVSGLGDATVVVEGRDRSGALHTARLAASQGRDVLAVPGPLHAPTSRAPLDLIRDGATTITRPQDVLVALGVRFSDGAAPDRACGTAREPAPSSLSADAGALLGLLGAVPSTPGQLAAAVGRPLPAVLAAVGELSRAGLADPTPRGIVRRLPRG